MTRGGVTKTTGGGDTAMTPEPSFNRQLKPSLEEEGEFEPTNVISILSAASGMVAIPPNEIARVDQISSLVDYYGATKTVDAMKTAFEEWKNTKSSRGSFYRKTNLGWIDWAQEKLMETSEANASRENGKRMIQLPDGTIAEAKL